MKAKAHRYYPPVHSVRTVESVASRANSGVLWRVGRHKERLIDDDDDEKWLMFRYIAFGFPRHIVHSMASNQAVGSLICISRRKADSMLLFGLALIPVLSAYDCLACLAHVVVFNQLPHCCQSAGSVVCAYHRLGGASCPFDQVLLLLQETMNSLLESCSPSQHEIPSIGYASICTDGSQSSP